MGLEYLCKDDRIVWYLSILQRLALVENRGNPNFHTIKWKKKRKRKLEGWTGARIREDFQLLHPAGVGAFLWCSGSSFPSIDERLSLL